MYLTQERGILMKKTISIILTLTLLLSIASVAYAKQATGKGNGKNNVATVQSSKQQLTMQKASKAVQMLQKVSTKKAQKTIKQTFKINGSAVIKYGKYKLPIKPITNGLKAELEFNKETGIITVSKDNTIIIVDLKNKTVTVNGVQDKDTNIFTATNSKKTTVLIKYIANMLGIRVTVDDDKVITETPVSDNTTANEASGSAITIN